MQVSHGDTPKRLRAPQRLAECRVCVSCLDFLRVSEQCPLPGDALEGGGLRAGQGSWLQPPSLCLCISLLSKPESKQPCAAAVPFNPFVIKSH